MPINQEPITPKRAWGVPRGKRIFMTPPAPFSAAYERYKVWHEQQYGTKPTDIDFFMSAALQQVDQLRKFHDQELKTYEGAKYGTNIDGIHAPARKRPQAR